MSPALILGILFIVALLANLVSWATTENPKRFLYYPSSVVGHVIFRLYGFVGVAVCIAYFWQRRAPFPTRFVLIEPIAVWTFTLCIWSFCYSLWRRHRRTMRSS
jgi:hypothetical protein